MSEQETVPGQASSRAVLARTTRSKASPGRERLMSASRSGGGARGAAERRMEPSQPVPKQSWKRTRRVAAAVVGVEICLEVTVSWTIWWKRGQD